jgi:hypothetical protein
MSWMMRDGWRTGAGRGRGTSRIAAWVVCACLLSGAPATAFELRVRGQAQLVADVRAAGTALQLVGALRDENGQPLPQRDVKLTIRSVYSGRTVHEALLRSDMSGKLTEQIELEEGDYDVALAMDADEHYEGAAATAQAHLAYAARKLELQAPEVVFGPEPGATARVRASAGGIGMRGTVLPRVDGRALEPLELDSFGRGQLKLDAGLVDGQNTVVALLEDRPGQEPAEARAQVRYVALPAPTLELVEGYEGLEYGLRARGEMADRIGPLAGLRVIVRFVHPDAPDVPEVRVETRTDEQGRFVAFVSSRAIGDGQIAASAEVRAAGRPAVVSAPPAVIARRSSQRGLHVFGALAILFGLGALLVRLASLDLPGWWARRRAARAPAAPINMTRDEVAQVEALDEAELAELPAAASLDQMGGVVWDVWRGQPVSGATLHLRDAAGAALVSWDADARGRFVSPPLPAGAYQVTIEAVGFARGVLSVSLPHDGRLSGSRVQLVAMPLKLRRLYQSWAAARSGEEVWGKRTPREVARALRAAMVAEALDDEALERHLDALAAQEGAAGADALDAVTRLVEEGYFGEREDADEALWRLMVALLSQLDAKPEAQG